MNLLVFGASGKTGHEVVNQSLDLGHHVNAFVRHPEKLKITHPNLTKIKGEISDYEQIVQALDGNDVVISTLGASSPFHYDQTVVDGMANIVRAMETNGVRRLIYMSFIGLKESRKNAGLVIRYIAPILLSSEIKGHERRENLIRNSSLDFTIVRPPTLTNNKRTGHYRTGETISSGGIVVTMSRADVAHLISHLASEKQSGKKTLRILY